MAKKRKEAEWPKISKRINTAGTFSWRVDLGLIDGVRRERKFYKSKEEAEAAAAQARVKRGNEGMAAFTLPGHFQREAYQAIEKLKPHGVTLTTAVEYYIKHVIAFKSAPAVKTITEKMVAEAETNNRRDRTVGDLRYRLKTFATDFGEKKLSELTLEEIKEWINDDDWGPRTRINFLTKISQLFNYCVKHGWCEHNLAQKIDRPDVEDDEPEIFTVDQAKNLLEHASAFGLLPYVGIGLFAGLRSAELMRLDGSAIKLDERAIVVGADVAKKRSRRIVEICDALASWLEQLKPLKGPIVDSATFRENMDALKTAAKIKDWPHNGLRHSFGTYHLALHGDQMKTAAQMGHRDAAVVHNHYKALVMKSEAEKFWALKRDAKY